MSPTQIDAAFQPGPCLPPHAKAALFLLLFLAPRLHPAMPATPRTLIFEAEDFCGGPAALRGANGEWERVTDDPKGNWSGGAVLRSPKNFNDRGSHDEGAPALTLRLTGIPEGFWSVRIRSGRKLAFSLDGNAWKPLDTATSELSERRVTNGSLSFHIDDRYGNPGTLGYAYLDAITLVECFPMPSHFLPACDPAPLGADPWPVGSTTRELKTYLDPLGRRAFVLTGSRDVNHQPTYHNDSAWSADSRELVFTSLQQDRSWSWLMKASIPDGKLVCLDRLPGSAKTGVNLGRYNGNNTALSARAGLALAWNYVHLKAVPMQGGPAEVLFTGGPGVPGLGHPAASLDGRKVYCSLRSNLEAPVSYQVLEIDLRSKAVHAVFGESAWDCIHVQPNPVDPDCLLVVRDEAKLNGAPAGPTFQEEARMWVVDLKTKKRTPILPVDASSKMLTHALWNFDGSALYYEVRLPGGRHEVGKRSRDGRALWHRHYPNSGPATHVGAHTKRDWMVLESEALYAMPRHFRFLKFDAPGPDGDPAEEPIALHPSDIARHGGRQEAHGHPIISPDGRWMSFGVGRENRFDLHVVGLE